MTSTELFAPEGLHDDARLANFGGSLLLETAAALYPGAFDSLLGCQAVNLMGPSRLASVNRIGCPR